MGALISELIANYSISANDFHVIGHSLGAQISGFAGKTVNLQTGLRIRRITGLDATGGVFENATKECRINSNDAGLVVGIHTDGGRKGFLKAFGHIDFFPNGGTAVQPGCEASTIGIDIYYTVISN